MNAGQVAGRDALASERREPPTLVLLGVFAAIAVALTYPALSHLGQRIPGDGGDSLLNLWIIRSVQIGLPHGWHSLWNARIFFPQHNTLAYSDTLFPIAIADWPLRTFLGDAVTLNLVGLGSWMLSSWCAYRLARRFVAHWEAAFVGALIYTYSAVRLAHYGHLQLVIGGALVPLVLLTLFRFLDDPSTGGAFVLGIAFAILTLTAAYYGAMTGIFVIVIVSGWALTTDRATVRSARIPLLVAAAVVAILAGPVGIHYIALQRDAAYRRPFDPSSAAHLSDFLRTGYGNLVLSHVPLIAPRSRQTVAGVENRLFPGVIALVFGAAGAVAGLRRVRRVHRDAASSRCGRGLQWIVIAGTIALLLSFGDRFTIGVHRVPLPFALFRTVVPGFAGIRATARLALGGELALALVAALGVDALLDRLHRHTRLLVTILVAACVVAESAITVNFVRLPTSVDDGGIDGALRAAPAGVVVELPIESSIHGVAWPYVEAPRQLLALADGHPRVNGYSGYQPPGFDGRAATLNDFPAADAIAELRRIGVRYVVLRTALASTSMPVSLRKKLDADGVGLYTAAHAQTIIAGLPKAFAEHVTRLGGGYLIEIAP